MEIDDAARQIRFRVCLGGNFFMEIAKIRAMRMVWAKIVSEFGGNERKIKLSARTAKFNKTVFDPYVNMLRTATEAFSGVVGGVDSMTVGAFDEIIRKPDEFSERIARNQQIILQEECNLADVIDPAGGSYYVENLTRELAAKIWEFFSKIESLGGMLEALKSGAVQDAIAATAAGRKKLYDTRRSSVVGTNNYANLSEKPLEKREYQKRAQPAKTQAFDLGGAKGADAFAKLLEAADKGAGIDGMERGVRRRRNGRGQSRSRRTEPWSTSKPCAAQARNSKRRTALRRKSSSQQWARSSSTKSARTLSADSSKSAASTSSTRTVLNRAKRRQRLSPKAARNTP